MAFVKAVKEQAWLRMALTGLSGAGKTYTSLLIGTTIAELEKSDVAVIDTERGSASKYADIFNFSTVQLTSFHPEAYIEAMAEAEKAGFKVLIIDSLSHAWAGKDGVLELVDKAAQASKSKNSYFAWREGTPVHNLLMDSIVAFSGHVIATMRCKMKFESEKDDRGKVSPVKIGLEPIQRDGVEYEFDIVGEMDLNNSMLIQKTRCFELKDQLIRKPNKKIGETIYKWLRTGAPKQEKPKPVNDDDHPPEPTFSEPKNIIKLEEPPEFVTCVPEHFTKLLPHFKKFDKKAFVEMNSDEISQVYALLTELEGKVKTDTGKKWVEVTMKSIKQETEKLNNQEPPQEVAA